MVITVRLFPGKPEPVAARASEARARPNSKWTPAVMLPAMDKLRVPATLVVASGLAARGQVEIWNGEPRSLAVSEVLERGTDFERVTAA
jgi:hypothetical protein